MARSSETGGRARKASAEVPPAAPTMTQRVQRFRRLLYMYGAVSQIELNGFLEANSIDTDDRKREIKARWREAAEVFHALGQGEAGMPDTISVRPLQTEAASFVEELQNSLAFKETFSNYPISFEEVEIDKIVASQRTVHLDFVEQIKAKSDVHSSQNLIRFCMNTGQDETTVKCARTAPNAFTLSSENPSLRFLGIYEEPYEASLMERHHPGGQPVHAITLLVGYGSSTMNVYRVGNRMILNNGFHRLYALKTLGLSSVPIVVQHVTHPELELPERIADLPRDYLVNASRPGLMKDFFDDRLVCEVRQPGSLKALQIGWGINENRVPL